MRHNSLISQVLAMIIFYDILSKSGEYSHARDCAPLLIYCLLKGIRVNIPKIHIDFMTSKNLLILSGNIPYGMMIIHLLNYFKIDLSKETPFVPTINIDRTLLKSMQEGLMPVPKPHLFSLLQNLILVLHLHKSDPYSTVMNQMNSLSISHSTSIEQILANQKEFRNNLAHICSGQRYLQKCTDC